MCTYPPPAVLTVIGGWVSPRLPALLLPNSLGDSMSKYKANHFGQYSRSAFKKLHLLKTSSKWLYFVLVELEHKFTGKNEDFFFRSIKDLSVDSGLSQDCVWRSLKELKQSGLIQKWQMHWWIDKEHTKQSKKRVTAIRLT